MSVQVCISIVEQVLVLMKLKLEHLRMMSTNKEK